MTANDATFPSASASAYQRWLVRASARMERLSAEQPLRYGVAVAVASFAIDFLLLRLFLGIPAFNIRTLVCPAGGVGPVLGLFFGVPGIVGCSAAAALSDVLSGADSIAWMLRLVTNTIYIASFRLIWFAVYHEGDQLHPRLDNAQKIAGYIGISLGVAFIAVVTKGCEDEILGGTLPVMRYVTLALNDFVFLVYLGMPLLIGLNRLPFYPVLPAWVRKRIAQGEVPPYRKLPRMNLTQRMIIAGLAATVAIIGVLNFLYFIPYPFYQDYNEIMPDAISGAYALSVIFTFIIFVPTVLGLQYLETHCTRPISLVTQALGTFNERVREGHVVDVQMDMAGTKPLNEVSDLVQATEQVQADLVDHIERLAVVSAERERVNTELDVARRIQMSVVPHDFDAWRASCGLDIYGFMHPAREVGGDFYDVLDLGEGRVGFIIGDVSGKGIPAALFMMRALNELRYQMLACDDLGEALTAANHSLYQTDEVELFVTAFVCVLDTRSGRLTYANAGHNPAWLKRGDGHEWLTFDPERIIAAFPNHVYHEHAIELAPGDGMLLYTDGITEAVSAKREFFGAQRLEEAILRMERLAAEREGAIVDVRQALEFTANQVELFAAGVPQSDDMTMLAFSWS